MQTASCACGASDAKNDTMLDHDVSKLLEMLDDHLEKKTVGDGQKRPFTMAWRTFEEYLRATEVHAALATEGTAAPRRYEDYEDVEDDLEGQGWSDEQRRIIGNLLETLEKVETSMKRSKENALHDASLLVQGFQELENRRKIASARIAKLLYRSALILWRHHGDYHGASVYALQARNHVPGSRRIERLLKDIEQTRESANSASSGQHRLN